VGDNGQGGFGRIDLLARAVGAQIPRSSRIYLAAALAAGVIAGHLFWTGPGAQALPRSSANPTTSHAQPAVALPPPTAGVCRNYSRDAEGADNEESTPVDCGSAHDALTVAVLDHPDVSLPYVGSYLLSSRAMVLCQRAAEHYLGIGPGVTFSRYSSAVFEPDAAQMAAGQRWIRCDLVKFPTYLGLMPIPQRVNGILRQGPGLADAYCVQPDALDQGLPPADKMEAPELGDWAGQADCIGTGAIVAVRRSPAKSPHDAPAACARESRRFLHLPLHALSPPASLWSGQVLCVARIADYETWVVAGRPLTSP
jgi:hypothetical protein